MCVLLSIYTHSLVLKSVATATTYKNWKADIYRECSKEVEEVKDILAAMDRRYIENLVVMAVHSFSISVKDGAINYLMCRLLCIFI